MPNQRSKNKAHLGGYVDKKLYDELLRYAKKEGMESNKFGFVERLILEALESRKAKKAPKKK